MSVYSLKLPNQDDLHTYLWVRIKRFVNWFSGGVVNFVIPALQLKKRQLKLLKSKGIFHTKSAEFVCFLNIDCMGDIPKCFFIILTNSATPKSPAALK